MSRNFTAFLHLFISSCFARSEVASCDSGQLRIRESTEEEEEEEEEGERRDDRDEDDVNRLSAIAGRATFSRHGGPGAFCVPSSLACRLPPRDPGFGT